MSFKHTSEHLKKYIVYDDGRKKSRKNWVFIESSVNFFSRWRRKERKKMYFVGEARTHATSHSPSTSIIQRNAKWQNTHHNTTIHQQRKKGGKGRKQQSNYNHHRNLQHLLCFWSSSATACCWTQKLKSESMMERMEEKSIKIRFQRKKSLRCRSGEENFSNRSPLQR